MKSDPQNNVPGLLYIAGKTLEEFLEAAQKAMRAKKYKKAYSDLSDHKPEILRRLQLYEAMSIQSKLPPQSPSSINSQPAKEYEGFIRYLVITIKCLIKLVQYQTLQKDMRSQQQDGDFINNYNLINSNQFVCRLNYDTPLSENPEGNRQNSFIDFSKTADRFEFPRRTDSINPSKTADNFFPKKISKSININENNLKSSSGCPILRYKQQGIQMLGVFYNQLLAESSPLKGKVEVSKKNEKYISQFWILAIDLYVSLAISFKNKTLTHSDNCAVQIRHALECLHAADSLAKHLRESITTNQCLLGKIVKAKMQLGVIYIQLDEPLIALKYLQEAISDAYQQMLVRKKDTKDLDLQNGESIHRLRSYRRTRRRILMIYISMALVYEGLKIYDMVRFMVSEAQHLCAELGVRKNEGIYRTLEKLESHEFIYRFEQYSLVLSQLKLITQKVFGEEEITQLSNKFLKRASYNAKKNPKPLKETQNMSAYDKNEKPESTVVEESDNKKQVTESHESVTFRNPIDKPKPSKCSRGRCILKIASQKAVQSTKAEKKRIEHDLDELDEQNLTQQILSTFNDLKSMHKKEKQIDKQDDALGFFITAQPSKVQKNTQTQKYTGKQQSFEKKSSKAQLPQKGRKDEVTKYMDLFNKACERELTRRKAMTRSYSQNLQHDSILNVNTNLRKISANLSKTNADLDYCLQLMKTRKSKSKMEQWSSADQREKLKTNSYNHKESTSKLLKEMYEFVDKSKLQLQIKSAAGLQTLSKNKMGKKQVLGRKMSFMKIGRTLSSKQPMRRYEERVHPKTKNGEKHVTPKFQLLLLKHSADLKIERLKNFHLKLQEKEDFIGSNNPSGISWNPGFGSNSAKIRTAGLNDSFGAAKLQLSKSRTNLKLEQNEKEHDLSGALKEKNWNVLLRPNSLSSQVSPKDPRKESVDTKPRRSSSIKPRPNKREQDKPIIMDYRKTNKEIKLKKERNKVKFYDHNKEIALRMHDLSNLTVQRCLKELLANRETQQHSDVSEVENTVVRKQEKEKTVSSIPWLNKKTDCHDKCGEELRHAMLFLSYTNEQGVNK